MTGGEDTRSEISRLLEEARRELERREARVTELVNARTALRFRLDDVRRRLGRLKSDASLLRADNEVRRRLEGELASLEKRCGDAASDVSRARQRIRDLEEELSEAGQEQR